LNSTDAYHAALSASNQFFLVNTPSNLQEEQSNALIEIITMNEQEQTSKTRSDASDYAETKEEV
jgi:hypothetical protein